MAKKKAQKKVNINQFLEKKGLHELVNNFLKENNLEEITIKHMQFNIASPERFNQGDCSTLICEDYEEKVQIGRVNGRTICKCVRTH